MMKLLREIWLWNDWILWLRIVFSDTTGGKADHFSSMSVAVYIDSRRTQATVSNPVCKPQLSLKLSFESLKTLNTLPTPCVA